MNIEIIEAQEIINNRSFDENMEKLLEYEILNFKGNILFDDNKNLELYTVRQFLGMNGITQEDLNIDYNFTEDIKFRSLQKENIHNHITKLGGILAKAYKKDNNGKSAIRIKKKIDKKQILDGKGGQVCVYPIGYKNIVDDYLHEFPITTWIKYKKINPNEYQICSCGCSIRNDNMQYHIKTKKHKKLLEKKNECIILSDTDDEI